MRTPQTPSPSQLRNTGEMLRLVKAEAWGELSDYAAAEADWSPLTLGGMYPYASLNSLL
jgi:hypothetical protein